MFSRSAMQSRSRDSIRARLCGTCRDRNSATKCLHRGVMRYHVVPCSRATSIPLQAWTGPKGSRRLRLPGFLYSRYMKVARLSALRTGRLYPQGKIPGTHFCYRPQSSSVAGRIKSMRSFKDHIENRNRDLSACSAVLQRPHTASITWCHVVSRVITWCLVVSCGITWCHVVSCGITWYHVVSRVIAWCHVIS